MAIEPYSSISCQALLAEKESYGGWLMYYTQGKLFKSVKNKYVVIYEKSLYIYSGPNGKTQSTSFALTSYRVEPSTELKDERWGFKLRSLEIDKPTHIFAAASQREREDWTERITKEILHEGDYSYALDDSTNRVSRILASGELPAYESPPSIDAFTGPKLHQRPESEKASSISSAHPERRTPPAVPHRHSTGVSEVEIKPSRGRGIFKQMSEHKPTTPKKDARKYSEPAALSMLSSKPKPIAPPRPQIPPKPQTGSPQIPTVAPVSLPGLSVEQKQVAKFMHDAVQMHNLVRRRDSPKKSEFPKVPEQRWQEEESGDEADYLECANEEEEVRLKSKSLPRGEPDGMPSRSLVKEKDPEKDPLPPSAVRTDLDRQEAENLLQGSAEGTYIIRRGRDVPRVLTVFYKTKIRHFKIFGDPEGEGGRLKDTHPAFRTDKELVQYYFTHDLPTDSARLSLPYM